MLKYMNHYILQTNLNYMLKYMKGIKYKVKGVMVIKKKDFK